LVTRPYLVDVVEDLLCASIHQVLCHQLAKVVGLLCGGDCLGSLRVHPVRAVDVHHRRLEPQLLAVLDPGRLNADRHAAPSLERAHDAPFRDTGQHCRLVLELLEHTQYPLVAHPCLDAQRTLSDGMQGAAVLRLEELRDTRAVVHAQQTGGREDDGREGALRVVALAEARLDVSAHVGELEAWIAALQLCNAAHAAGADDAAVGQVREGLPAVLLDEAGLEDDDVARVFALGHAAEGAAVGERCRHVLEGVDDDVELLGYELSLELRCPQALAAEVVQRRDLVLVAQSLHAVNLKRYVRSRFGKALDDDLSLLHRQRRPARANMDDAAFGGGRNGGHVW
ncbi:hypothetical protein CI238_04047, partial [Colletotrichum incanum]